MADPTRSQYIFGRIRRQLDFLGVPDDKFLDEDIYDSLSQAQDQIISEVALEYQFDITLKEDIKVYPLYDNTRPAIDKIKSIMTPSDWRFKLEHIDNSKWNMKSRFQFKGQPLFCSMIGNNLNVAPTPSADFDSSKISPIAILKSSIHLIDKDTDPDLPLNYDKELENLCLYYLTSKPNFYNDYETVLSKKLDKANPDEIENLQKECYW